jgi:hypothetical protein
MSKTPAVNPNVNDIADRAKYAYATATHRLAIMQYRLAELAGTGRLNPDESMRLQDELVRIWEALYFGTLCAVRDETTADCTWDEADNTYRDGRQVRIQIRIEPYEGSECSWEHNGFTLGDGAVAEHPRGTICYITPVNPEDDRVVGDPPKELSPDHIDAPRRVLRRSTAPIKRTSPKVMGRTDLVVCNEAPPPTASTPCARSRTTRRNNDDR